MKQQDFLTQHIELKGELQSWFNSMVNLLYLNDEKWNAEVFSGWGYVRVNVRYGDNQQNSFEIVYKDANKNTVVVLNYPQMMLLHLEDGESEVKKFYSGLGKFLEQNDMHTAISAKLQKYVEENNKILKELI